MAGNFRTNFCAEVRIHTLLHPQKNNASIVIHAWRLLDKGHGQLLSRSNDPAAFDCNTLLALLLVQITLQKWLGDRVHRSYRIAGNSGGN